MSGIPGQAGPCPYIVRQLILIQRSRQKGLQICHPQEVWLLCSPSIEVTADQGLSTFALVLQNKLPSYNENGHVALQLIQLGQMTDALAKWAAALDTFDSIKHNFRAPGQVEKALNSIALDERVLLFRGSDSDIVERLSPYDQVEAMGRGGLDYETLHRNLSLVRSYVDPKVLNQMIRFFAPQIPLADQQLLPSFMTQLRPVH
ncbi:TPA: hypothetical protein ACH3X1_014997 [Trebouxia sp. C0004]